MLYNYREFSADVLRHIAKKETHYIFIYPEV